MELTCLNCTGSFSVDDGDPSGLKTLRCPMCGHEQRWVPQPRFTDPAPLEAEAPAPPSRSDGTGGAFRRPMQAFSGMRSGKTGSQKLAPRVHVIDPETMESVAEPEAAGAGRTSESSGEIRLDDVAPLSDEPPPPSDSTETWVVRSPSGLVLEFPSSNLLLAWSAVLDNPAPYQVSRAGSLWTSLEQIIREMERGKRSTQALLRTLEGGAVSGRPAIDPGRRDRMELGDPLGKDGSAAAAGGGVPPPLDRSLPSTSQFQFKIAESKPQGLPGWVVLLVVTVGVLAAAGVAAYFLLLR
jgi:hypothetical protein